MAKSSPVRHWLLKTEPETYSFDQLLKDRRTNWDHVRNFQARNFLREMKTGDLAFIYHSMSDKAVVGIAECVREAYADADPDGGDWVQVDLKPVEKLARPVELGELKATPSLKDMLLLRQSRLSCMPVSEKEYATILKLAAKPCEKPGKPAPRAARKKTKKAGK